MRNNPVQFAVVREDPLVEADLMRSAGASNVLMVGSGGCTAISLQALFPDAHFKLFDINPAQIELVQKKMTFLNQIGSDHNAQRFNIEDTNVLGLNQCGNFESLFRGMRELIYDLVAPQEAIREMFYDETKLAGAPGLLFDNPYWPVVFDLYFSDSLLNTMFGPEATQHARPGSYPGYFRELFERGLQRDDAFNNYFLHHVLLGYYINRPESLPHYLTVPAPDYHVEFSLGKLTELQGIEQFDIVGLSNIIDWMDREDVQAIIDHLRAKMKPGSWVIYRQLNNDTDVEAIFGDLYEFDASMGERLHASDRSLFYSSIHVGRRKD